MTPSCGRIDALVRLVQSRFLETPELTLTLSEAQERFGVDEIACEAVLGALVDARVLAKTRDGACVRWHCQVDERSAHRPPRYWTRARREHAMLGVRQGG